VSSTAQAYQSAGTTGGHRPFALLLFAITSLEAKTLGFTAEFPDERVRGSAYSLSDSDYADAWSQGSAILRKNAEIYEYVRISRESTEAKIQTFNRLRRENNERMDRLYAFLRSRGTRVR
jgi:hypothetical protein